VTAINDEGDKNAGWKEREEGVVSSYPERAACRASLFRGRSLFMKSRKLQIPVGKKQSERQNLSEAATRTSKKPTSAAAPRRAMLHRSMGVR
jgi:hypothetical protein